MQDCIFCKIIKKEIPSTIIYEDEFIMAFDDIAPQAKVHTLVIPKKHIHSLAEVNSDDSQLLGHLMSKCSEIAEKKGIKDYRLIANCGVGAGQEVFHLHFHILGGQNLGKLIAR